MGWSEEANLPKTEANAAKTPDKNGREKVARNDWIITVLVFARRKLNCGSVYITPLPQPRPV